MLKELFKQIDILNDYLIVELHNKRISITEQFYFSQYKLFEIQTIKYVTTEIQYQLQYVVRFLYLLFVCINKKCCAKQFIIFSNWESKKIIIKKKTVSDWDVFVSSS